MSLEARTLQCPNCGGAIVITDRVCSFCRSPIVVHRTRDLGEKNPAEVNRYVQLYRTFLQNTTGKNVETLVALGICLLKRKTYTEAKKYFEEAISLVPDDGEPYYFLALSMLQKKRPYRHTLNEIKQIVQHLESALTYSTAGKYYYLLYLIQKDFYDKKRLRNGKNSADLEAEAFINEVDDADILECKEYCDLTEV